MKSINKIIPLILAALLLTSCKSCKDPEVQEQALQIRIDPAATAPVRTTGSTYSFKVWVDSNMPEQGVEVEVSYKKDTDQATVFNQRYTTASSPLDVTVTGIPYNEMGTVVVVATSKSRASNTASKTFQLVRK